MGGPLLGGQTTRVVRYAPRRPELNYDPSQPDQLTVVLRSGQRLNASCAYPTGAPRNPMSRDAVREKVLAIAGPRALVTLDAVMAWDSASDLAGLLSALQPLERGAVA